MHKGDYKMSKKCNQCEIIKTHIKDMIKEFQIELRIDNSNIVAIVAIDIYKEIKDLYLK